MDSSYRIQPFSTENEAKHSGFGLFPGTQPGVYQWPQGACLVGEMVIRSLRLARRLSAGTDALIYLVRRLLAVHNFGILLLVLVFVSIRHQYGHDDKEWRHQ